MAEAVKKLNGKIVAERDEGQGELVAIGQAAVPLLRQAANNVDELEGSARARQCLQAIEGRGASTIVTHAARLLASRKPIGAAEVLVGYLPYADDDSVQGEVEAALVVVAFKNGKPDPVVLQALKDRAAIRRGAAASVICQAGGSAYQGAVRPLLKDPRASVRLRAALGLVGAYDADAIPVLIELVGESAPRLRRQAEEYLTNLAGEWAVRGPTGHDRMSQRLRREVWAAWWKNTEGDKLLDEFRSRTLSDDDREKALALIKKLDDPKPEVRNAASTDLVAMGARVAPLLRRAITQESGRVGPFAARCLEAIEKDAPNPLPAAAPRLLALRKPEGTVEALLAYLPSTESEDSAEQIIDVLGGAGVHAGKADEALVRALEDKVALRRTAAAVALTRGRAEEHYDKVRKLLKDRDADVRLGAARSLAGVGERNAVPVLIALLGDLPLEKVFAVEDMLAQLAEDKAPNVAIGADPASRSKAVAAWNAWWRDHGKTVDLARLGGAKRLLGYTLVVEMFGPTGQGRVFEMDSSGRTRWELKPLYYPMDAKLLRNGNVLVVENSGSRLVERDPRTNREIWSRWYNNVVTVQAERNGGYFLVCRNQILLADKDHKELFKRDYHTGTILAGKRFRDGSIAYIDYGGNYFRLDRTGKEVKRLTFPINTLGPNNAEILPGDRVVICSTSYNKVLELDPRGKTAWERPMAFPQTAVRLSNGHILVCSNNNQTITELDRRGKVVSQVKAGTYRPWRAYKR
jgi:HEAT repeat protein